MKVYIEYREPDPNEVDGPVDAPDTIQEFLVWLKEIGRVVVDPTQNYPNEENQNRGMPTIRVENTYD